MRHPFLASFAFLSFLCLFAFAGCGDRTPLLVSTLDGSARVPDGGGHCDAATCPNGCCDSFGVCEGGTSALACGTGGGACSACPSGDYCATSTHACTVAAKCGGEQPCPAGCCDTTGTCEAGTTNAACGIGGEACQVCTDMVACNVSTRTCATPSVCNAATCPSGCCQSTGNGEGFCVTGTDSAACGAAGAACVDCLLSGETCDPAARVCTGVVESCGPSNCPGCCLGNACSPGGTSAACGQGGRQCGACPPGIQCIGGACQAISECGPGSCQGCCDPSGNCQLGDTSMACGQGGSQCFVCPAPGFCAGGGCAIEVCDGGNCGGCSPATCPNGCCDNFGNCQPGTSSGACGSFGQSCFDCGPAGQCVGGSCETSTCDSQTCPTGCCDVTGTCQPGQSSGACGTGGVFCAACAPGAVCAGGVCKGGSCNPMTCPTGCCDATGACVTGGSLNDCGTGGRACVSCPIGSACVGGGCVGSGCNANNCPNGCCDVTGVCQAGDTSQACGEFGGACATCGPQGFCNQGTCENSICDASTCPTGCCDTNGACQPGNDPNACGTGASQCQECAAACVAGICQPTACNFNTCPNGCCDTNDVCQPGTSSTACGPAGGTCVSCGPGGVCTGGECAGFTCGPSTCPDGCCDSNGDCQTTFGITGGGTCPCAVACAGCCDTSSVCHAGTLPTECGSNGATCEDCTTMALTCDTNVFPVVCDQTCPSPYPGCAPGTTEAAPQPAPPNSCKASDLSDAATACAGGAESTNCTNFLNAEFSVNANCANCLEQFDYELATRTGIYLCAQPFVGPACDVSLGCAQDCESQGCGQCSGDINTCDQAARTGECSQYFTASETCLANNAAAKALCGAANYANFGAWLQAVGAHYCQ